MTVRIVLCPSGPLLSTGGTISGLKAAMHKAQVELAVKWVLSACYKTYHFTSLFVSITARHHLNIINMAAELLRATGGRMEQMEQQMGQMSEMKMSSSSASNFSSSTSSTKLRKVLQGLSRTMEGR